MQGIIKRLFSLKDTNVKSNQSTQNNSELDGFNKDVAYLLGLDVNELSSYGINASITSDEYRNYKNDLLAMHSAVSARNTHFSALLQNYVRQQDIRSSLNTTLKCIVFIFYVTLLIVFSIRFFDLLGRYDFADVDVESLVSLLTVTATYVGSFIGSFEIITKYLFPPDEEKDASIILQALIENDKQTEESVTTFITNKHQTNKSSKDSNSSKIPTQ